MEQNYILYDGDCPFCARYVALTRLREAIGPVNLINARERPDLVTHWAEQGFDINQGIVFMRAGLAYFGADALHQIALVTNASGLLNRINTALFGSSRLAKMLYPMLKASRNLTLAVLGRSKLR